jgi:hypothetical protein
MHSTIFSSLALLLSFVSAHGSVTSYSISSGGKATTYPGYQGFSPQYSPDSIQRQWPNYDPTFKVGDIKMRCNGGTSAKLSAPINAGDNITAIYQQWTHQQGPVMVWLYECQSEFSACAGDKKRWFKIDQLGLWGGKYNSNNWGTAIIYDKKQWTSRIPASIKPGNYLIRHELIALHQANTPQFYAECAQLVISGSGVAMPPDTHLFSIPTYAPQSDPGIAVCIPFQVGNRGVTNRGLQGRYLHEHRYRVHLPRRPRLDRVQIGYPFANF